MAKKSKEEGVSGAFVMLPWWASLIAAFIVYVLLKFFLADLISNPALRGVVLGLQSSAEILVIPFFLMAIIFAFKQYQRRRLLDVQAGIHSIRAMSWQAFEAMVGEIYRRQMYYVEEPRGARSNSAVDLLLLKGGHKIIVQCRRWRDALVDVPLVQELYEAMAAEGADGSIFLSSGGYSQQALAFANGKSIELIDGARLVALVRKAQSSIKPKNILAADADEPVCPKCGRKMIRRTAKVGANAGQDFWGCSGFPDCREIVDIQVADWCARNDYPGIESTPE